jgi:hypothetical protein
MNGKQINEIRKARKAVKTAELALASAHKKLREVADKCDHFDGRSAFGNSAVERKSTHDELACGGFKECAVCAGEQEETFINVCRICKKQVQ